MKIEEKDRQWLKKVSDYFTGVLTRVSDGDTQATVELCNMLEPDSTYERVTDRTLVSAMIKELWKTKPENAVQNVKDLIKKLSNYVAMEAPLIGTGKFGPVATEAAAFLSHGLAQCFEDEASKPITEAFVSWLGSSCTNSHMRTTAGDFGGTSRPAHVAAESAESPNTFLVAQLAGIPVTMTPKAYRMGPDTMEVPTVIPDESFGQYVTTDYMLAMERFAKCYLSLSPDMKSSVVASWNNQLKMHGVVHNVPEEMIPNGPPTAAELGAFHYIRAMGALRFLEVLFPFAGGKMHYLGADIDCDAILEHHAIVIENDVAASVTPRCILLGAFWGTFNMQYNWSYGLIMFSCSNSAALIEHHAMKVQRLAGRPLSIQSAVRRVIQDLVQYISKMLHTTPVCVINAVPDDLQNARLAVMADHTTKHDVGPIPPNHSDLGSDSARKGLWANRPLVSLRASPCMTVPQGKLCIDAFERIGMEWPVQQAAVLLLSCMDPCWFAHSADWGHKVGQLGTACSTHSLATSGSPRALRLASQFAVHALMCAATSGLTCGFNTPERMSEIVFGPHTSPNRVDYCRWSIEAYKRCKAMEQSRTWPGFNPVSCLTALGSGVVLAATVHGYEVGLSIETGVPVYSAPSTDPNFSMTMPSSGHDCSTAESDVTQHTPSATVAQTVLRYSTVPFEGLAGIASYICVTGASNSLFALKRGSKYQIDPKNPHHKNCRCFDLQWIADCVPPSVRRRFKPKNDKMIFSFSRGPTSQGYNPREAGVSQFFARLGFDRPCSAGYNGDDQYYRAVMAALHRFWDEVLKDLPIGRLNVAYQLLYKQVMEARRVFHAKSWMRSAVERAGQACNLVFVTGKVAQGARIDNVTSAKKTSIGKGVELNKSIVYKIPKEEGVTFTGTPGSSVSIMTVAETGIGPFISNTSTIVTTQNAACGMGPSLGTTIIKTVLSYLPSIPDVMRRIHGSTWGSSIWSGSTPDLTGDVRGLQAALREVQLDSSAPGWAQSAAMRNILYLPSGRRPAGLPGCDLPLAQNSAQKPDGHLATYLDLRNKADGETLSQYIARGHAWACPKVRIEDYKSLKAWHVPPQGTKFDVVHSCTVPFGSPYCPPQVVTYEPPVEAQGFGKVGKYPSNPPYSTSGLLLDSASVAGNVTVITTHDVNPVNYQVLPMICNKPSAGYSNQQVTQCFLTVIGTLRQPITQYGEAPTETAVFAIDIIKRHVKVLVHRGGNTLVPVVRCFYKVSDRLSAVYARDSSLIADVTDPFSEQGPLPHVEKLKVALELLSSRFGVPMGSVVPGTLRSTMEPGGCIVSSAVESQRLVTELSAVSSRSLRNAGVVYMSTPLHIGTDKHHYPSAWHDGKPVRNKLACVAQVDSPRILHVVESLTRASWDQWATERLKLSGVVNYFCCHESCSARDVDHNTVESEPNTEEMNAAVDGSGETVTSILQGGPKLLVADSADMAFCSTLSRKQCIALLPWVAKSAITGKCIRVGLKTIGTPDWESQFTFQSINGNLCAFANDIAEGHTNNCMLADMSSLFNALSIRVLVE